MAQSHEVAFDPSSPHSSSGGADSYKHEGTPDTRLTAFSPDEGSAKSSKLLNTLSLSASKANPDKLSVDSYRGDTAQLDRDPFVTTNSTSKGPQKLSATASAFRPFSAPLIANGSAEATPKPEAARITDANQNLLPVSSDLSTNLQLSRCLTILSPSEKITLKDINAYLLKFDQLDFPFHGTKQIQCKNDKVHILFSNLRDSCMVQRNVKIGSLDWEANFVSPTTFVQSSPDRRIPTYNDGQISLLALLLPGISLDASHAEAIVFNLLLAEGDMLAFQRQAGFGDCILRAVVEYYDVDIAMGVLSKYNGFTIEGIQIVLSPYKPDDTALSNGAGDGIASPGRHQFEDLTAALQSMSLSRPQQSRSAFLATASHAPVPPNLQVQPQYALYQPLIYRGQFPAITPVLFDNQLARAHSASPSTASVPLLGPAYPPMTTVPALPLHHEFANPRSAQNYNRQDGRRQHAMRISRSPYYNAAGHHNHVDVNRIREGIDVRTTIMLRNIPNKVDQAMLKRIVDESSWGKYDFMYLRIDFANDCNVGYAFINFVDPLDIIDFVNARGNQRWNCFKSDKVAEISYATIQGKDCLVQKFRNSSVMLEAEHYRPKLYYTSNGPVPELAGQEEPFPGPDNQSKMKRSCENAEHVGLFTPNAGQHFRDEQRRRRSQYDRGTRLAALEEYDYETALQQLYAAN